MKVTQASLRRYREQVDEQAERARRYFSNALDAYMRENPGASVAEVRGFTLDLFGSALPNFTDLTETLACDLFDEIAEECGFEGERARLYDTTDYQVVESKVHYFAGLLAEDDTDRFKREVADVTRYFCKRAAFDNMVENCRAQKVKWARMPTGFETCPFCFMLSSRGFVYANEKTASEGHHGYHDNCDCVPVPGFQDAKGNPRVKIDGYDPETMYRNWSACEKSIGGREQARAEWLALREDERNSYIKRHGNASKAFARFEQNRIQNEVATRDWHWLYTGKGPKYKADDAADPDQWEQMAGEILRLQCGLNVVFKTRSLKDRRADTLIGGVKYEFKNPKGSMPLTIHNQVKKNLYGSRKKKVLNPQSDRLVISNVRSNLQFDEMVRQAEEVMTGITGFNDEELSRISEIVILDKTGKMRRLKR